MPPEAPLPRAQAMLRRLLDAFRRNAVQMQIGGGGMNASVGGMSCRAAAAGARRDAAETAEEVRKIRSSAEWLITNGTALRADADALTREAAEANATLHAVVAAASVTTMLTAAAVQDRDEGDATSKATHTPNLNLEGTLSSGTPAVREVPIEMARAAGLRVVEDAILFASKVVAWAAVTASERLAAAIRSADWIAKGAKIEALKLNSTHCCLTEMGQNKVELV